MSISVQPVRTRMLEAIDAAGKAPSVHNSQPWRWRLTPDGAELYFEERRWLGAVDPEAHDAIVSCGGSLGLAVCALLAAGVEPVVRSRPIALSEPLATVDVRRAGPVTAAGQSSAGDHLRAAERRISDRRPLDGSTLPSSFVADLRARLRPGLAFHLIRGGDDVLALAHTTELVEHRADAPATYRDEVARWFVPARDRMAALPHHQPSTLAPFSHPPHLTSVTDCPAFVVVLTEEDGVRDWLRAGQAAVAVLLAATHRGLASCAVSAAVRRRVDRNRLREAMGGIFYPQLVLRIGTPLTTLPSPRPAPRRALSDLVEDVDA